MNDFTFLDVLKVIIVPLFAAGTAIWLSWLKLHADSRKKLDDLLIELEHDIYNCRDTHERVKVFLARYLEIRKAASEFGRWIFDPFKKRRLQVAMKAFRGQKESGLNVFDLRGTQHEPLIDVFVTNSEIICLAPHEYKDYVDRIANLRKITGSRVWGNPSSPVI